MLGGAIFERLLALHPKVIDLSLERMTALLAKLGNPERRLPRVIHIAGTNGKGSTGAFCRAMLEAAGLRVHAYTSPHLVRFNERIRLAGAHGSALVNDERLIEALERCERVNDGAPITFFEITTAAAFLLFSETPADFLLLEVGLGGRLDATNVIDTPALSIITPVSMDHEGYLGDTIELIAAEKAGILKRGVPAIIAPQEDAAMQVIEVQARRVRAPLSSCGEHWHVREEHGRLVFENDDGLLDLPAPRLAGRHQFINAGVAIAAMRHFPDLVDTSAIEAGLTTVEWTGRLQRITSGCLIGMARGAGEVWLDGGHNPGAGAVIAQAMGELEERVPRSLVLVAGMLSTKDATGFFRPFEGLVRRVFTIAIPDEAMAVPAATLAEQARKAGLVAQPADSLEEALQMAAGCGERPRILVCGSLHLAGYALKMNS